MKKLQEQITPPPIQCRAEGGGKRVSPGWNRPKRERDIIAGNGTKYLVIWGTSERGNPGEPKKEVITKKGGGSRKGCPGTARGHGC